MFWRTHDKLWCLLGARGKAGQLMSSLCSMASLVPAGPLMHSGCDGGAWSPEAGLALRGLGLGGWEVLWFVPTLQPSPRTVTFTYLRAPALVVGVVTTIQARCRGQVAGGLITVTTLTTHRQKSRLPAKRAVCKALPKGVQARKTGGATGTAWARVSGPTRTGAEPSCQCGA